MASNTPKKKCHGNGEEHCCWLGDGGLCPYLEENTVEGRRWACGLRRELRSWKKVHADPRYLADVQPFFDDLIERLPDYEFGLSCGDWEHESQCCNETPVTLGSG
jgi:hypothetical protein